MKTYITKNSNGFMFVWLDEPTRNDKVKTWNGKYFLIDSLLYEKCKELTVDNEFHWESEPLIMSF